MVESDSRARMGWGSAARTPSMPGMRAGSSIQKTDKAPLSPPPQEATQALHATCPSMHAVHTAVHLCISSTHQMRML